jgi:hypothetical protein
MRRSKPSLRSSLWALLGYSPRPFPGSSPRPECRPDTLAPVRQRILELLGHSAEQTHPTLFQRIRHAGEAEALWYVRQDLVVALAEVHGEASARESVASLNALFTGLLPSSLIGRRRSMA